MMPLRPLTTTALSLALGLLAVPLALAHSYKAGAIEIGHPWARVTGAGQRVGGGYLTLKNAGVAPDRLIGASAPAAERVELHLMKMEGDVMHMQQVPAVDLPAGQTVEFKPGSYHLMLMGLKQPLKAGSRVPLTLKFEKAGEVQVELAVDKAPAAAAGEHMH